MDEKDKTIRMLIQRNRILEDRNTQLEKEVVRLEGRIDNLITDRWGSWGPDCIPVRLATA